VGIGGQVKPVILGLVILLVVYAISRMFDFEFSLAAYSGVVVMILYYLWRHVTDRCKRYDQ